MFLLLLLVLFQRPCVCLLSVAQTDAQCAANLNLVFVVDASGSIQDQPDGTRSPVNWNALLNFVVQVGQDVGERIGNYRVGEVVFSETSSVVFPLEAYNRGVFPSRVRATPYEGSNTNIAAGLRNGYNLFTSSGNGVENVLILLTDGIATREQSATQTEGANARRVADVFAVGITNNVNQQELVGIVGGDSNKVLRVEDFASLEANIQNLVNTVCGTGTPAPPTAGEYMYEAGETSPGCAPGPSSSSSSQIPNVGVSDAVRIIRLTVSVAHCKRLLQIKPLIT